MTLPIQPICGDNSGLTLRGTVTRRKPCFSAAWADPPIRREKRRAICSWSVGYGTLNEYEDTPKKVAEQTSLSEARGRRLAAPIPIPHAPTTGARRNRTRDLWAMPGLKSLVSRRRNSGAGTDSAVPLVRCDGNNIIKPAASQASLRKCETVLALANVLRSSSSSSSIEPILPVNRLRVSPNNSDSRVCSRCSSLLSLASGSKYSLNASTGSFVPVPEQPPLLCKLCLIEVPFREASCIQECQCSFCINVRQKI